MPDEGIPIYDVRVHLVSIIEDVLHEPTSAYALTDDEAHELANEIADAIVAAGWPRKEN